MVLAGGVGGSPLLQQGELDFSPAENPSARTGALAPEPDLDASTRHQIVHASYNSGRIRKEMVVSPQTLSTPSAAAQQFVDSVNPATGEVVARIPATPISAIPGIFETARSAQKAWAARPLRERCAMLRKLRDAIFERRELNRRCRHTRDGQAPRRSDPRRNSSRPRHCRLPRATGPALASSRAHPAPQYRSEN